MLTRTVLSLVCLASLSCASTTSPATSTSSTAPRSIIFLIADGAGAAHFTVAKMLRGDDFQTGRLPYTGMYRCDFFCDGSIPAAATTPDRKTGMFFSVIGPMPRAFATCSASDRETIVATIARRTAATPPM